jgi:hypothetical protein
MYRNGFSLGGGRMCTVTQLFFSESTLCDLPEALPRTVSSNHQPGVQVHLHSPNTWPAHRCQLIEYERASSLFVSQLAARRNEVLTSLNWCPPRQDTETANASGRT